MASPRVVMFQSSRDSDYKYAVDEYEPQAVAVEAKQKLQGYNLTEEEIGDYTKDYARLLTFKNRIGSLEGEAEGPRVQLLKNRTGQDKPVLTLLVELEREGRDNFSFLVINGQIAVDPKQNMQPEDYQDLVKFCWINGISDVQFPDVVDKNFQQEYMKAEESYDHHAVLGYGSPTQTPLNDELDLEYDEGTDVINQSIQAEAEENKKIYEEAAKLPQDLQDAYVADKTQEQEKKKEIKQPDLKKLDENLKKYMARLGKEKDSTYYRNKMWKGYLSYRLYGRPEDRKSDGVYEKGSYKETYEVDLRFKIVPNTEYKDNPNQTSVIVCRYATPGRKDIDGGNIDEIISMLKGQGVTMVDCGPHVKDSDKGKIRESCARFGLLPTFNLNEHHVNKMMGVAASSLSAEDVLKYKRRMAKKLRKQIAKGNEDIDKSRLRDIIIEFEAENGIVPTGIVLTAKDAATCIEKAKRLPDDKLMEYKLQLAQHLRQQIAERGEPEKGNPLMKTIEAFEAEYKVVPFKEAFEGGIRNRIDEVLRGDENRQTNAVKVIGAVDAAYEFYSYYNECSEMKMNEFMAGDYLNLPSEKAEFLERSGLKQEDLEKLKLRDIGEENLSIMYECMIGECEHKARTRLIEGVARSRLENSNVDPTANEVKNAEQKLQAIYNDLEAVGQGIRRRMRGLGSPVFSASKKEIEAVEQQILKEKDGARVEQDDDTLTFQAKKKKNSFRGNNYDNRNGNNNGNNGNNNRNNSQGKFNNNIYHHYRQNTY